MIDEHGYMCALGKKFREGGLHDRPRAPQHSDHQRPAHRNMNSWSGTISAPTRTRYHLHQPCRRKQGEKTADRLLLHPLFHPYSASDPE